MRRHTHTHTHKVCCIDGSQKGSTAVGTDKECCDKMRFEYGYSAIVVIVHEAYIVSFPSLHICAFL